MGCAPLGRGDTMLLSDNGCLISGGVGGGGTVFMVLESDIEEIEDRNAEAGTEGCENGLPGPFGASPKV